MDEKDEIILNLSRALAPQEAITVNQESDWKGRKMEILALIDRYKDNMLNYNITTRSAIFKSMSDLMADVAALK